MLKTYYLRSAMPNSRCGGMRLLTHQFELELMKASTSIAGSMLLPLKFLERGRGRERDVKKWQMRQRTDSMKHIERGSGDMGVG